MKAHTYDLDTSTSALVIPEQVHSGILSYIDVHSVITELLNQFHEVLLNDFLNSY